MSNHTYFGVVWLELKTAFTRRAFRFDDEVLTVANRRNVVIFTDFCWCGRHGGETANLSVSGRSAFAWLFHCRARRTICRKQVGKQGRDMRRTCDNRIMCHLDAP